MIEIHTNLFIGNENDYEFNVKNREGRNVIHTCKEPYHLQALSNFMKKCAKKVTRENI